MRLVILGTIGGVIAGFAAPAFADDIKAADEKFEQAQTLRDAGKNAESCHLFRAALDLNPNMIGAILTVARCAAEEGKVATAVHYFTDAQERAREAGLAPQLGVATDYLAQLTPRVPHLKLTFADQFPAQTVKIVISERVVDLAASDDVLVDPGNVEVVVSAPGRTTYRTAVPVAEAEHKTVAIPKLGYPVTVCSVCRPIGKIAVGVGAAATITGVVLGFVARSHYRDTLYGSSCNGDSAHPMCGVQGDVNKLNDAVTLGNIGSATAIAGIVVAVGGAALWYFTPSASGERMAVVPVVTPDQAGLAAVGHF